MESIAASNFRCETNEHGVNVVAADFSPPASDEWQERFLDRLNATGHTKAELSSTGVKVPFHGQSVPEEAAIRRAVAEANGA